MKVKTNIIISAIFGCPIFTECTEKAYKEWESEYLKFLRVLPEVKAKGISRSELDALNLKARQDAIFKEFDGFKKFCGYFELVSPYFKTYNHQGFDFTEEYTRHARAVVQTVSQFVGDEVQSKSKNFGNLNEGESV